METRSCMYFGERPWRALNVNNGILKWILYKTGFLQSTLHCHQFSGLWYICFGPLGYTQLINIKYCLLCIQLMSKVTPWPAFPGIVNKTFFQYGSSFAQCVDYCLPSHAKYTTTGDEDGMSKSLITIYRDGSLHWLRIINHSLPSSILLRVFPRQQHHVWCDTLFFLLVTTTK